MGSQTMLDFARPHLAILIDPEKANTESFEVLLEYLGKGYGDVILIGGSTATAENIDCLIEKVKARCSQKIYLFPGNQMQLSDRADGILVLSLLSGRNPEYLIGKLVDHAIKIKGLNIDTVSTAYLLIEGGKVSAIEYVTKTKPIPIDQSEIILATATSAELLGFKAIYLEAGSGAINPVSSELIKMVRDSCQCFLIVGGGIKTSSQLIEAITAGADLVVIGNILEEKPELLPIFCEQLRAFSNVDIADAIRS